jgi:RimJ/RimL family protein N-acetyltransferase
MNYRIAGDDACEIGIKICDASQQNKGLGKIILSLFIRTLFEEGGFRKILLDTNLTNTRAQHVYEQLGFRKLRVNVDSWTDQLGRLQSAVDYELMPGDFVSFI